MNDSSEDLMVRAAWMYYHDGLTQRAIADRLDTSRVAVTRLLQRARDEGIVQIKIRKPLPICFELERRLQESFDLQDACVVPTQTNVDDTLDEIGRAGADHLHSILRPNLRLGFGWSTTVSRMAPYLESPAERVPCVINDLAGSMLGEINPYSVSAKVAETLSAPLDPLSVPVVLQSETARDTLLTEPSVRTALANARTCDTAFAGLGEVGPDSTMIRTGYLTPTQMATIQGRGAVGEILMRFFDEDGNNVPTSLDAKVISLEWEDIQKIPDVVIMAAGIEKIPAIRGALRGGLCTCLITDVDTAQALLSSP